MSPSIIIVSHGKSRLPLIEILEACHVVYIESHYRTYQIDVFAAMWAADILGATCFLSI